MKIGKKCLAIYNHYHCFVGLLGYLFFTTNIIAQDPGDSEFDTTTYIEYVHGNYPLIISVPHGGHLEPMGIDDRNCNGCVYSKDSYTQEMAWAIYQEFHNLTGHYPHMIINRLHRIKLDANRLLGDGANPNSATAIDAWNNYQGFIESAKTGIVQNFGRGLLIDLHGHGHPIQRVELGYILMEEDLNETDQTLDTQFYINRNSIKNLVNDNVLNLTNSQLVRGPLSFGSLLFQKGYPSVPSETDPFPNLNDPYFSGGQIVFDHGAWNSNEIDAFQIECHQDVRFDADIRDEFSQAAALTIVEYMSLHYGVGTIDFDNDGVFSDSDCDDLDSAISPNVNEVPYNGIDDDCDPNTLDDDLDGDGFDNAHDCDDGNAAINPGTNEIPYNGIDDDCDANTLDDDLDGDGFDNVDDCDDGNVAINPGTNEVTDNGIDDDCNPNTPDQDESETVAPDSEEPEEEIVIEGEEQESQTGPITIYPNPANQYLHIETDDDLEFRVEFFDLAERLVLTKNVKKEIIIESLANGVYILKFKELSTGKVFIRKLVINN